MVRGSGEGQWWGEGGGVRGSGEEEWWVRGVVRRSVRRDEGSGEQWGMV